MNKRSLERAVPWAIGSLIVLLIASTLQVEQAFLLLIVTFGMMVIATNGLFRVEGYVTLLALYYWLGIANPFHANVHGVTLPQETTYYLVILVSSGIVLLWTGAAAGRRLGAGTSRPVNPKPTDDTSSAAQTERLYNAAWTLLGAGMAVAILSYMRLGVPALSPLPDLASGDFVGRLSPFTYYQWLLIDVGIGAAFMAVARDRGPDTRFRRVAMITGCLAGLTLIGGVFSRVAIGTPVVIAAVVWWTQGRRFARLAVGAGVASAVFLVGIVWLLRLQALGPVTLYGVDFDLTGGLPSVLRAAAGGVTIFARTSVEVFGLFVQGLLPRFHGQVTFMSLISLLPGRHPGLGLFRVSQLLGYDPQRGTTVSLFGGMYADFGAPGIVVGATLIGALLGGLERLATQGDRLNGLFYGIVFSYYLNMIYGGQLIDASLLWKVWIAILVVRYSRSGFLMSSRIGAIQTFATLCLYGYGLFRLAIA